MTSPLKQVQPVIAFAAAHLDEDLSLEALAGQAGLSAFHLHRVFSAAAGETPKQFTLRLRLARASAMLLTTSDSVLDIALECGFQSHEAFCRAFRRRFRMTPSVYRTRGFAGGINVDEAMEHAGVVNSVAPCIGLFHNYRDGGSQKNDMAYSITTKEIPEQPVLVVRRRVKPSEVAATLGEVLGYVFTHAQQNGIALAGQPLTRYVEMGARNVDHRSRYTGDGSFLREPAGSRGTHRNVARWIGGHHYAHWRLRQTEPGARGGSTVDRGRGADTGRSTLGIVHHRSGRLSRSERLEDRDLLAGDDPQSAARRRGDETCGVPNPRDGFGFHPARHSLSDFGRGQSYDGPLSAA